MANPQSDFRVTLEQATAPKPKPPNSITLQDWIYYYDDLARWRAIQADRLMYGIKEDKGVSLYVRPPKQT